MRPDAKVFLFVVACALLGCDDKDGDATLSVNLNSDSGNGNVAIEVPGFGAKIALPADLMKHGDFDIDGVKLYSGSTITRFNVDAKSTEGDKDGRALVNTVFSAPADIATVRAWFLKAFGEKGVTITPNANGLAGKTKDGDDFTMTFAPDGSGKTKGEISIVDKGE